MEGSLVFLFAAVVVIWVAVFLYLLNLSGRLDALRRDLDALEHPVRENDHDEQRQRES